MGHLEGTSRHQRELMSASLDERVAANHPIRVIDAFVETLDLGSLSFSKVVAQEMGRPCYRPSDLLKLYVYGYSNQMRSSRRLEKEAGRNMEVQWLINRLEPSFKTIADFRRDHASAIVAATRAFVRFCRDCALLGGELVAIDGSKIEAVASRKQVITPKALAKRAEALDRKIERYLEDMDEADRDEASNPGGPVDVAAALEALKRDREDIQAHAKALADEGLTQKVIGEPDARLMRTARHGHQVAYNAQTAVDGLHGLIVAFDLTNDGNDFNQLLPMAEQAKAALGQEAITVVADTGYSNGEQGEACGKAGITAAVPRPETVHPKDKTLFSRDAFTYDGAADNWTCPAGETLTLFKTSKADKSAYYKTGACTACPLRPQCTQSKEGRTITRHAFEDARQAMHERTCTDPVFMKRRRELVEHPFGIMKWMLGTPRFLVRSIKKAKAELALAVIGFNLKRIINIIGVQQLLAALHQSAA
jgi:transposase